MKDFIKLQFTEGGHLEASLLKYLTLNSAHLRKFVAREPNLYLEVSRLRIVNKILSFLVRLGI